MQSLSSSSTTEKEIESKSNAKSNVNENSNAVEEEGSLIQQFRVKRQQQKCAQVYLASQYPKTKQIADVVVMCVWVMFAIRLSLKIVYSQMGSVGDMFSLLMYTVCAALVADLGSGMIHWGCDTYGTLHTPVFGKTLIRSFREHHVDPTAITRHPFAETCGNSFIVTLPWIITVSFLDVSGSSILIFGSVVAFWLALTNQIHKWAHTYNPPAFIKILQKCRIILQGKSHNYHHFSPYDRDYCITTGWLNPLFLKFDLWKKMENFIQAHTGTPPRQDDKHWTFQDAIPQEDVNVKKQT